LVQFFWVEFLHSRIKLGKIEIQGFRFQSSTKTLEKMHSVILDSKALQNVEYFNPKAVKNEILKHFVLPKS